MKRIIRPVLSFVLIVLLLVSPLSAKAAQPSGFWPLFNAYQDAVASGDTDNILKTGDAILSFYAKYPMSRDIAEMSYNIYFWRFTNAVFEHRGNYDAAIYNAERLADVATYLGFTDAVIAARALALKLDPLTEVYALSENTAAATYYGAKFEPLSGTYIGRVADTRSAHPNIAALSGEAIASFYYSIGNPESSITPAMLGGFAGGEHVLHIAMNFPEGEDASAAVSRGTYDAELKTLLSYIATLKCPVLLRLGAEMNLWEPNPAAFRDAYRHLAGLIRSEAPNAALIWSPNYVGSWGSNIADYYPGDDVVDWVGLSLYTSSTPADGHTLYDADSAYFGRGAFGDCILSLRETAIFAQSHAKPVMITEGGTGIINKETGAEFSAPAAAQVKKMYGSLNMVYPNVKAIVYFDADPDIDRFKFAMSNSAAVQSAYGAAVAANPSLIAKVGGTAPGYVKLDGVADTDGKIELAAYGDTVYSDKMNVTYYLSGKAVASLDALPYRFTLDASAYTPGKYEFKAVFSDGAGFTETKTYTLTKLASGTAVFSSGYTPGPADAPAGWAATEVGSAAAAGLIPEALQVKYTPNITRYDFCRLVVNLIAQKTGKSIDEVLAQKGLTLQYGVFSDTTDKNVLAAYALGIVNGCGGGLFVPDAGITREEAAKMLAKAGAVLSVKPSGAAPSFVDTASFSSWAADAIAFVASSTDKTSGKTVMGGVGGSRFDPKGMYTYQQAYITMLRLYNAG
jgi:hypothetical protein